MSNKKQYNVYYNITITEEGRELWLEARKKARIKRDLQTPQEWQEKHEERIFGSEYVRIKKDIEYLIKNGANNPYLPVYLDAMQSRLNNISYE